MEERNKERIKNKFSDLLKDKVDAVKKVMSSPLKINKIRKIIFNCRRCKTKATNVIKNGGALPMDDDLSFYCDICKNKLRRVWEQ